MVGVRLSCLSCFFTCSFVLLLGVCLYDVEASSCQKAFHKKVGDDVEFSTCLPTEKVTIARWKCGGEIIADIDNTGNKESFKDRLYLNPTNHSLTVRRLTLQDSGVFSFVSERVDGHQRQTVIITLKVHELITKQPILTSNLTWHTLNESCTVSLECSATTDSNVTYNWTVRNQTSSGSGLQYSIRVEDGNTNFTCTINNFVSQMSASKIEMCSNKTQEESPGDSHSFRDTVIVAGGGCLMALVLVIVVGVCYCKRSKPGIDLNDLTVYADISEVAVENDTPSFMKSRSVYETIDNSVNPVTPGPKTVYDKIQFSRMRKASVSPYQDIS